VVHLVGGLVGLVGTISLGPRLGRFKPDVVEKEETLENFNEDIEDHIEDI